MKIVTSIIIFLILGLTYSQPYLPMLDGDNIWGVRYFDIYGPTISYEFRLGEDVIINNKTYKRVYTNGVATGCSLREEDGVLYKINSSNVETIQLDFTLNVGDVFMRSPYPCLPGGGGEHTVLSASTQFIANENRRVLEINYWVYREYWIEGIGSTNGGIYSGDYEIEAASLLQCFYHDGETYYFNNAIDCNIVLSNADFSLEEIVLHPNPVTNISILQLPAEAPIDYIKIYDLSGKLVNEESVNGDYFTISAMDYPSGLYFYSVFSYQRLMQTQRFIVK